MRPSRWMIAPCNRGGTAPRPRLSGVPQRRNERINRRRPELNRRAGAMPSPAGVHTQRLHVNRAANRPGLFPELVPPAGSAPAPRLADARRIAVMPPAPTLAACCPAEREVTMDRPGKLSARRGGSPGTRTRWRLRAASVHRRDPCPGADQRPGSACRFFSSSMFRKSSILAFASLSCWAAALNALAA